MEVARARFQLPTAARQRERHDCIRGQKRAAARPRFGSLRADSLTFTVNSGGGAGQALYQFTLSNSGATGGALFDLFLAPSPC
jgi:hypothetical protein